MLTWKNEACKFMNVIDLFSGVGGLSLGAARAGFDVKLAVEIDSQAIETHHINFPHTLHLQKDVAQLSSNIIHSGLSKKTQIDGVIGGPPCQGFSAIGKGNPDDHRNELYMHFFRLVNEIKPKFFLAENVPGIMQEKFNIIRENALSLVRGDYYLFKPLRIKASDYGAPTIRTRIFFIGIRKDINISCNESFFLSQNIKPVTVAEALQGLPSIINDTWQKEADGWQPIERNYTGTFFEHLWGNIPQNIGNEESIRLLEKGLVSGFLGTVHNENIIKRYASLKFGEIDRISRSARLDPQGFCPTLRAGTGSDKGSYQAVRPIHPYQPRVITPREAARLQGFPDWFRFHGTKWHSFRQIGNSVSPIVAEFLLKKIHILLNEKDVLNTKNSDHNPLEVRV